MITNKLSLLTLCLTLGACASQYEDEFGMPVQRQVQRNNGGGEMFAAFMLGAAGSQIHSVNDYRAPTTTKTNCHKDAFGSGWSCESQ